MTYRAIDAEAVKKGIEEGKEVDAQVMAEMQVKMFSKEGLEKLKAEATSSVETEEPKTPEAQAKEEKEKELSDFEKEVRAELKIGVES